MYLRYRSDPEVLGMEVLDGWLICWSVMGVGGGWITFYAWHHGEKHSWEMKLLWSWEGVSSILFGGNLYNTIWTQFAS